jgi:hypothetical protein
VTQVQPPPPPVGPPLPIPAPGGGLAVAALVLGLCSFIPFAGPMLGLTAVILGIVALAQKAVRRGMATAGIVTGAAGVLLWTALLVAFILPPVRRAKGLAKQAVCQANLSSIAKGYIIYATEWDTPPLDIDILVSSVGSPQMFKCPCATSGRASDYFYLAPGADADPQTIIACDFKGNHPDGSRNVARHEGSVSRLTEAEFQAELGQPHNAAFAAALRKVEGP